MGGSYPTPPLTGAWRMTIVHDILTQLPGLGQPPRQCLATLCVTSLGLRGRVNCRTRSRYCDSAERTIARQFREPFAWPACPQRVLRTVLAPRSALVSAQAAACLPKRGKPPGSLGPCCNGCASRAERGLEMATRAVVDVTRRCALTRAAGQTPPGEDAPQAAPEDTRVDCSTPPLRAHRQRLPPRIP